MGNVFVVLLAAILVLLREMQEDEGRTNGVPTYKHPHAHDNSILDKFEDFESWAYGKLEPHLHDQGIVEEMRRPINLRAWWLRGSRSSRSFKRSSRREMMR